MEKSRIESEPKIGFNIIDESEKKGRVRLEGKNVKSNELLLKYSNLLYDYSFLEKIPYGDSALGLVLPIKSDFQEDDEISSWEEGSESLAKKNIMWQEACNKALETIIKIKDYLESESGAKKIEELHKQGEKLDLEYDKAKVRLAQDAIEATMGEPPAGVELKRVQTWNESK